MIEAEKELLAALVFDPTSLDELLFYLKPEHFKNIRLRKMFSAMMELNKEGTPINTVSLSLKSDDSSLVGDLMIMNAFTTTKNKYYAAVIIDDFVRRQFAEALKDSLKQINGDPYENIENLSEQLSRLQDGLNYDTTAHLYQRVDDIIKEVLLRRDSEDETLRSRNFPEFNKLTGGLIYPTYMSLQGKDKSAKTTFALSLMLDFAAQGIPVGFINLETSSNQTDMKMISLMTGFDYNKLRNPKGFGPDSKLNDAEVEQLKESIVKKFSRTKIYSSDKIQTELGIGMLIKKWKRQYGCRFFCIDYIGLIPSSLTDRAREERIGDISRYFRQVSKDENIIILVLSQQNRSGEIAESKALERDPDYCFEISSPYRENGEQDYQSRALRFNFCKNHYLVRLKRSRHTEQGGIFVIEYNENQLRQLDIKRSQEAA